MSRILILLAIIALVAVACTATSESGEASEPVVSGVPDTTAAGAAALTTGSVDADTCEGVLGAPPDGGTLKTRSFTDTIKDSGQSIKVMCNADFESSTPGDPFLSTTLIEFDTDEPAVDRYEMIKDGFVVNSMPISEVNSADENLVDQLSILIDSDGVGRIVVLRQNNRVLTITIGPSMEAVPWTAADITMIGESIMERWKG
jgi:hypothetical protein